MNKKLFVISGFSGVGKGTVINRFMQKHKDFVLSVSCTTRKPRPGETDGVNYFFLSNEEFEKIYTLNQQLQLPTLSCFRQA